MLPCTSPRDSLAGAGRAAAQHTEIFPVAMVQLLQANRLSELRLSMSSGFWAEAWGGGASVPPGLALALTPETGATAEESWDGASSAVSGLFCPALAALRYEDTVSPRVFGGATSRLYATKPQEVMCKDHLGVFTRLLPCGSGGAARSSLTSALAHALTLSNSRFFAVELKLKATPGSDEGARISYSMSLVVSVVLQRTSLQLDAKTLSRMPGADVRGLQGTFLSAVEPDDAVLPTCCLCQLPGATSQLVLRQDDTTQLAPSVFRLMPASAAGAESAVATDQQQIQSSDNDREFASMLTSFWESHVTQPASADAVSHEKHGYDVEAPTLSGAVAGAANSYRTLTLQQTVRNPSANKSLVIVVWQPIPWVLDLRLSTLKADVGFDKVDGREAVEHSKEGAWLLHRWESFTTPILLPNAHVSLDRHAAAAPNDANVRERFGLLTAWFQPSHRVGQGGPTADADSTAGRRRSPGSLEVVLRLPPASTATVSVSAERSFLYFTDYPPDAARGIDVAAPSGAYYYFDLDSSQFPDKVVATQLADMEPDGIVFATAGMLVPVAWPDFSMPYNVICISCTIPMMVFGAVNSDAVTIPVVGGRKPRPVHAFILWFLRTCDLLFGG